MAIWNGKDGQWALKDRRRSAQARGEMSRVPLVRFLFTEPVQRGSRLTVSAHVRISKNGALSGAGHSYVSQPALL